MNVADQRRDPDSLLNWTERIIRTRKECPEISWGDWQILRSGTEQVLAMRYDWEGQTAVFLHNFADEAVCRSAPRRRRRTAARS